MIKEMREDSITVSTKLIKTMLEEMVNVKCPANLNVLTSHLVTRDSSSVDFMLSISRMSQEFIPLEKGDYCIAPYPDYFIDEKFNLDIVKELGLYPGPGLLYAVVVNDTTWANTYNKYSPQLKIDFLVHDEHSKLQKIETTIDHLSLTRIDKESILYFKRHGKD